MRKNRKFRNYQKHSIISKLNLTSSGNPSHKTMSCRSKLYGFLLKQNKSMLSFNDPTQQLHSKITFYNSFQSGRRTVRSPVHKVRRRSRGKSSFGKDKFINALDIRPTFGIQSVLKNTNTRTLQKGVKSVQSGLKTFSVSVNQKILNSTEMCFV